MRAPAALIAIPLLAGSVAGLLLADRPDAWLPLAAAAASLLALLAAVVFMAEGAAGDCTAAIAVGALAAGVSLGLSDARAAYRTPLAAWFAARPPALREEPVRIVGVLRDDGAMGESGPVVTLTVLSVQPLDAPRPRPMRGGVRLGVSGAPGAGALAAWRAGRRVRVPAILRAPTGYRDPGLPDEPRALARRGVVLVGTVKSAALVEVLSRGSRLDECAASVRAWVRVQLARFVGRRGGPSGGVATAILIGDCTGLSDEDERRLQEAGTYHVIAISGGNIAILTALLLGAARLLRIPARASAGLAIAVLVFYGEVAGGGASVRRAVLAAAIFLAGRILDHRGPALNALATAAASALAASALTAFDAGFVLSFGATLGILVGAPRLLSPAGRSGGRPAIASAALALLVATVCAELALAPAGAAIFSRITFAGLIFNFAAIPLMTLVQAAALATLAAAPVLPRLAAGFGWIAHAAATWLVRSAALVDLVPWLSRDVPPPGWWLVALYYGACLAAVCLPRRARRALAAALLCLALMAWAPPFATAVAVPPRPAGAARIVFFDVGQGDATLVLLPDGHALLVDAGGALTGGFDVGARVVAPALRALGVRALSHLVITHADPDHIGGAVSIVRGFGPRGIWEGVPVPRDPALQALAAAAVAARASWRVLQAGDLEREGTMEIRVLHPPPPDWERQRVRNDDSVVLELRVGEVSIVLPGDVERGGEQILLPRLALAPLVVLKAPHHGSATSSTAPFLAAVHPRAVIFSAGRNNRFGHPAAAVVERYAAAGVEMFNTATDGAVILDTDGTTVSIRGGRAGGCGGNEGEVGRGREGGVPG